MTRLLEPVQTPPPPLRSYQGEALDGLRRGLREGHKRQLLVMPTGAGKCLGRGTPVLMFDGTIRPVESITPGDLLMGDDSTPRRVLSTVKGRGPLYRISPVKGESWVCNDVHILSLVASGTHSKGCVKGNIYDIPLNEYLDLPKSHKHVLKQFAVAVDYPGQPLPIEPYWFGLWLGDGSKKEAKIWKPDIEVETAVRDYAAELGGLYGKGSTENGKCPSHSITGTDLRARLRALGVLNNKHIPQIYLSNSRANRLALFAGLIDTDGYVHNGSCEIAQKQKELADGIAQLARSLGFRALISIKPVKGVDYYRINISGDFSIVPTRIPRKQARPRRQVKDVLRTGFDVEPLGDGEYFGFEIDGNRRFLLGDHTVTHNTRTAAELVKSAAERGNQTLWLADRLELVEQASGAFDRLGLGHGLIMPGHRPHEDELVLCGTVQSMAARMATGQFNPRRVSVIVLDEAHRAPTSKQYLSLLREYPHATVIGLTATPVGPVADVFSRMVQPVTTRELMDAGHLVRPRYFIPSEIDLVRAKGQDFTQVQLDEYAARHPRLIGDIVETFTRISPDRRACVFPCNIRHSVAIRNAFHAVGIPAVHIDGTMERTERQMLMQAFRDGEYQVLTSVNIAIEGLDVPDVSSIVIARPTQSERIWIQCLDSETEILTPKGWARMGEILKGEEVYGFDTKTGQIRSVSALETYRRPLGGGEKIVGVSAPHLDIRVTDGHRMVYKSRSKTAKNWQIKTAGELLSKREAFKIPVSGIEDIEPTPHTLAQLKFIGLFLSDGCLDGGTISIAQSLSQPQWIHDEIISILDATGFGFRKVVIERRGEGANYAPLVHYKVSKNKPKKGRTGTGWAVVQDFVTKEKSLTAAYESLSRQQVLALLEGLWLGDGTKHQGDGWVKQTQTISFGVHHTTAAQIQSLCVRRGIRANLATYHPKPSAWNKTPAAQSTLHYHPEKQEAVVGTAFVRNGSTPWAVLPHVPGEEVWCVENELGTLITRRNGKVAILGNCVGRGLRTFPGKTDCTVQDHAGAYLRLGPAEDFESWTLTPQPHKPASKSRPGEPREPRDVTCEQCQAVFHASRTCPECGHVHTYERAPRDIEMADGELLETTRDGRKKAEYTDADKARWYGEILWYLDSKGRKPGQAFYLFQEKFGEKPGDWQRTVTPTPPSAEVLGWIRSRNIRFAKRREKANAAD